MSGATRKKRLIVGISGASGVIYGVRLLQQLRALGGVETHLVVSEGGARTLAVETDWRLTARRTRENAVSMSGTARITTGISIGAKKK
mgnify:CR=1 FL=1